VTLAYTYDGAPLTHDIAPSGISLPQRADMGEASFGGIPIEDPDADLTLLGHRPFIVEEDDCSQPRLFTGYVTERGIGRSLDRGMFVGANPRLMDTTIVDSNSAFGFRQITGTDGNRPAETWGARVTWLLGSDYLSGLISTDETWVITSALPMDAADYRKGYPSAVLDDLSDRITKPTNWFAFWDSAASEVRLFFDYDTETIGDCSLRISNVDADIDSAVTFAPDSVASLAREPDQTYSGVTVEYANGSIYRHRASTAATYIARDTTISRPYTGSAATAGAQAEIFLDTHEVEIDRITCTIQVPAVSVGLVRAGQRISVKFSHMPGYSAFTWMRIVACSPQPTNDLATHYAVALELVGPRPAGVCAAGSFSALEVLDTQPLPTAGWPSISITPTAGRPCVIVGAAVANNHNVSADRFWVPGAGWTTLVTENGFASASPPSYYHPLFAVVYKAVANPSGAYTPNGTYTVGCCGDYDSWWCMAAVALQTDATAPVQDVYGSWNPGSATPGDVTLPTAPTPGNALLMILGTRDDAGPELWVPLGTGWTKLGRALAVWGGVGNPDDIHVWVRCVEEGDGTTWGVQPVAAGHGVYVSEWVVNSGSADTTVTLPPPSGTTTHTTDPTVNDDATAGYIVGAVWVNTTTGTVFVLVDSTPGAAVWVIVTTADLRTVDYLVGTATSALSAEIVVGTTPGGDLGGTWAAPVVEAVNGVTITGTPAQGNIIVATSPTTAIWAAAPWGAVRHWPMLTLSTIPES
jgi:hypothetical protein